MSTYFARSAVGRRKLVFWGWVSCAGVTLVGTALREPRAQPAFAGESHWTPDDTATLLRAVRLMLAKGQAEAVPLLLPLYERDPHHVVTFTAKDVPEWEFGSHPCSPAAVLHKALLDCGDLSKTPASIAVAAGMVFRSKRRTMDLNTEYDGWYYKEQLARLAVPPAPAVTVNDRWVRLEPPPLVRDSLLCGPLVPLGEAAGFAVSADDSQRVVRLRRRDPAPAELVVQDGSREALLGPTDRIALSVAPFRHQARLMVSLHDFARMLNGTLHWFPEFCFAHIIVPASEDRAAHN